MFRLIRFVIFAAVAFAVAAWISSQAQADAGVERGIVIDPVSGARAPTAILYPTAAVADTVTLGPYRVRAVPGAPPASDAKGLIVVSHGAGGGPLGHVATAVALAEAGFVVAAPQHPGDNFSDFSRQGSWEVYAGRPRTLSAVIDALLDDPRFAEILDGKPVGAMGLSMGGYTVLALAGASPSLSRLGEFCARNRSDAACQLGIARPSAVERDKALDGLADPRLAAAIVMSPATAMFATDGFSDIAIPLRFYVAGQDAIVHPDLHAEPFRDHFPPAFEYVRVEAAGHLSFATPIPQPLMQTLPSFLQNPEGFDWQAFSESVNGEIVEFFERTLR